MLVLSALLPPRVRTRTGHTWLIHLATVTEAILNPYKSYTSPLPIASVRSLSTYPALSFSLVKSVSASFSNAVHAVAIRSRQQLSGLGILGKPDSLNSWTEVVRGRFAYRLPNLLQHASVVSLQVLSRIQWLTFASSPQASKSGTSTAGTRPHSSWRLHCRTRHSSWAQRIASPAGASKRIRSHPQRPDVRGI